MANEARSLSDMRRVALLPVLPWPSVCPPNGWEVPLLLWHASWKVPLLLWHASRLRLAGASARQPSARRRDSGQRNSPGLNAQPGAPARAGASHGACNASECSPRLAQMRPSSPPTVHRLLKKHCDESAMNAAPATDGRLVMTQLWGVVCHQSDSLCVRDSQGRPSELQ